MSASRLSTALLCLGTIALGATQYLSSPWPGVALAALSLLPWAWEMWLGRRGGDRGRAENEETRGMIRATQASANAALEAIGATLKEQQEQINSLRSTVSARSIMGG